MLIVLYFCISTLRSMCAVRNMTVFCSSFISCFSGVLLTYFLNLNGSITMCSQRNITLYSVRQHSHFIV